jgi:hypothetical protein
MKKKKIFLLLVFVMVIGFILPKDVFATSTSLKFKTEIESWNATTDLSFTCGSSSVGVTPTVYIDADDSHLTATTCGFNFSDLQLTAGDDFIIVEEYDFSSYSGTAPEYQNITISPGLVSSATVDYDDDDYMFGDYEPTDSENAVLYNMNPVDANNNITGPLYVYDAYFEVGSEKTTEKSLGVISIPTYCVNFHFNIKGNIANAYGDFLVSTFSSPDFQIGGGNGTTQNVCAIGTTPLTKSQYDTLVAIDANSVSYENVDRYDEYVMGVTAGSETISGSGVKTTDMYVTATLESDGSQTGLLYTIIPFIILISLVVLGYLIIRNNEVKVDKEII